MCVFLTTSLHPCIHTLPPSLPPSIPQERVLAATHIYRALVSAPVFPRFITTFLYEQALFQQLVRKATPAPMAGGL